MRPGATDRRYVRGFGNARHVIIARIFTGVTAFRFAQRRSALPAFLTEQTGNVVENKRMPWKGRERSRNV